MEKDEPKMHRNMENDEVNTQECHKVAAFFFFFK